MAKWTEIGPLGEGGQGRVSRVRREGMIGPGQTIAKLITGLSGIGESANARAEQIVQLETAIRDISNFEHQEGAKKQLLNSSAESVDRLILESRVYETISDPHLLKILDKDLSEHWIITEFHPNGTLEMRLPLYKGDVMRALRDLRPLVSVLAKLHQSSFVHRDFKPGNIFVSRSNELVLGDAGLAFYVGDSPRQTKTYESVGTQHYMPAWAYARRLDQIRPTFDVFSVGKVIWALIAGEPACPLWYVLDEENNLVNRFPGERSDLLWVNNLLTQCVVEREKDMKIHDAAQLLQEIDLVLEAVSRRAIPPDQVQKYTSCRLCYVGVYEPNNIGVRQSVGRTRKCNRCGHLEFFD